MAYTYLLAGENLELAEAELKGFLKSQKINERPERKGKIAWTQSEPSQLRRLALTHEISKIIEKTEKLETRYKPKTSYKVRTENLTEKQIKTKKIEEKLGKQLSNKSNKVDLEDPEEIIKVYILEDEYIITRQVLDVQRGIFKQRRNQNRPFSSPVSLDPVLARVLINLSEAPAGGKVLDPFCGTGGILIEAGLCGIEVHGADIQEKMVEGTRKNLENYGIISHNIKQSDISKICENFSQDFNAVITDLPYGKSSVEKGDVLEQFISEASDMGDKTVFVYDKEQVKGYKPEFEVYVHKNLTRYLYVL